MSIYCLNCWWAHAFRNIFKNFDNKKFLYLSLKYTLNSAGHSENFNFFGTLWTAEPRGQRLFRCSKYFFSGLCWPSERIWTIYKRGGRYVCPYGYFKCHICSWPYHWFHWSLHWPIPVGSGIVSSSMGWYQLYYATLKTILFSINMYSWC